MNKKHILTLCGLVAVAILCALWFTQSASTPIPSPDKQVANAPTAASSTSQGAAIRETPASETTQTGVSATSKTVALKPLLASAGGTLKALESAAVPGTAKISVGGKSLSVPCYSGHYARVLVRENQTVPIELSWPEDTIHPDVFVQAVHGGKIDDGANNKRFALGADKKIAFTFTPDSGPGTYEIVLRRGATEEALSFWVSTGNRTNDLPTIN